jgi:hypothetical protein
LADGGVGFWLTFEVGIGSLLSMPTNRKAEGSNQNSNAPHLSARKEEKDGEN